MLLPPLPSRTRSRSRVAVSVVAVSAMGFLAACGASDQDQQDQAEPQSQGTPGSAEGATEPGEPDREPEGSAASPEGNAEVHRPGALSEQEKLEVLLSSADLPVSPQGHSTYEDLSYFQESIAVEYTHYQDSFDETECSAVMDRINVDLVGEDPRSGLAHAYTLPAVEGSDQEYQPQIYVWVLSYDREVDTSSVWHYVHENCTGGQLASGTEEVEIEPFSVDDSAGLPAEGISMVIHRNGEPIDSPAAVRHSMTLDFGDNLVMLSAVGLDEEDFADLAAVQAHKLADYADRLDDDA
ncbi:hypothetical protein [Nesterenkonia sphaerica]|uniref:Sensor domain-containing protein n=1 Tax=Nesterenkonia sphaerica TaxID=1804988 RepID=A0A5R9ALJ8_9MICC|nr:hypothetical protein [Nesterenkonia sphaerica]TLP79014.1 hypothetical protein FEF27_03955 [Nesterenkonia sphaerica]